MSKIKDWVQELLDKTDIDERAKAKLQELDAKARSQIEKYLTDKARKKALIIGAVVGFVLGFGLKCIL